MVEHDMAALTLVEIVDDATLSNLPSWVIVCGSASHSPHSSERNGTPRYRPE